jgi:pyruvate,orthophosphate dikinase
MTKGLNAGPGAAAGRIALSADEAEELAKSGPVVLCRTETSPEDLAGMVAAKGILTARGGMTSHAAVVARGMGKPCVCGASGITIDLKARTLSTDTLTLKAGTDFISIDGSTGEVFAGQLSAFPSEVNQVLVEKKLKPEDSELFARFQKIMTWSTAVRRLKVRTNADTPHDAQVARAFGAEGIGLTRTEHMFFEGERIVAMREMILSETEEGRRAALAKLLPMQRQDFTDLFEIMTGLPVTIRLLDPPLHEFLPHTDGEIAEVSKAMGVPADKLRARSNELHEFNPMLGFRGVRLAVRYPEIAEMQARAIFEGAVEASRKTGAPVIAEVMIPVTFGRPEVDMVKAIIVATAEAVAKETGVKVPYTVGTMIELPRAALQAGEIAKTAEFFSFGTNDLTQTTLGVSRDDAASFLGIYVQKGLLPADPFVSIDTVGVGEMIKIAVERGRATRPNMKMGICGEHGGDPSSITFCESVKLDYVSCSPFRVPIARLAAAQAALGQSGANRTA